MLLRFGGFVMSAFSDLCLQIEFGQRNELRQNLFQIFYGVFFSHAELYVLRGDQLIHFIQLSRYLAEGLLTVLNAALFQTQLYLLTFAVIFVPSIYTRFKSTSASANIYRLISMNIFLTLPISFLFIKLSMVIKLGAVLSSSSHIKRLSVLHSFSICRTETYPFSMNENRTTRNIFSESYSGRPVLLLKLYHKKDCIPTESLQSSFFQGLFYSPLHR